MSHLLIGVERVIAVNSELTFNCLHCRAGTLVNSWSVRHGAELGWRGQTKVMTPRFPMAHFKNFDHPPNPLALTSTVNIETTPAIDPTPTDAKKSEMIPN
ncbi:hypothetical protein PoB_001542900 [Plakobranchus ocellatus]|uniref:Uncharacterized protein n=1 Tax=Plakobranchus ocellatus TaxID=259542 RepID=A0AAV3Z3F1_9GAST|nr:hypothetical protein PoB_001542900 [Plakobranchus ocellatus]